jgi:hypothetical protein
MRPVDWPSYLSMQGSRAARVNEAARILLTPDHLSAGFEVRSPRACRGNIVFAEASERVHLGNELFERADASNIHCVLSHIETNGRWLDHFEVGHRAYGRLTWYVGYRLWMRSEDDLAWLVPPDDGPSFSAGLGELAPGPAPYSELQWRHEGVALARRVLQGLVNGRH